MKTDIILRRNLVLSHPDGTASQVIVCIRRPLLSEADVAEYGCDYEIEGLSRSRRFSVVGIDEIQAVWLALVAAGADLERSDEGKAGRVTWLGERELGFPREAVV